MMWFDIIKMPPNPYLSESGKKQQWKFLTREQYYEMNDKDKSNYHRSMYRVLDKSLKILQAKKQPLAGAPETLQNELLNLQKERNFHGNQINRIESNRGESVFSIEEDKDPPSQRLQTTPMGNLQYGEWDMTEEEYNAASREEKLKYHMRQYLPSPPINVEGRKFYNAAHKKEVWRMNNHPKYTAPYNPSDAKPSEEWKYPLTSMTSKEEYENMSKDDKIKFHNKLYQRARGKGDVENKKFHKKMSGRLVQNIQLPIYYSLEEERNA